MSAQDLRPIHISSPALPILATVVLWASAFPSIRAALEGFSPAGLAALRFAVAAGILLLIQAIVGGVRPRVSDLPRILASGALGIAAYNIALNMGELTVSAGAASFLVNTAPIFTALLATLLLGERIGWRSWAGMAVGLAGVGLIARAEAGASPLSWGAALILLAAALQALYFVLMQPLIQRYGPLQATSFAVFGGAAALLPWFPGAVIEARHAPAGATLAVFHLAVFPAALAYLIWSVALQRLPAARAAAWLYLVPPVATLIGMVWPGEIAPLNSLLGGAIALAGVLLVQLGNRAAPPAAARAPLPSASARSMLEGGNDGDCRQPETGRVLPPSSRSRLRHG
jgi:drug/metabolite transporter (DMT)-like permease